MKQNNLNISVCAIMLKDLRLYIIWILDDGKIRFKSWQNAVIREVYLDTKNIW